MNSNNITKKLLAEKIRSDKRQATSDKISSVEDPASSAGKLPPTTYHLPPNSGFTLIELMVTLSLFVILTTIVLFSNSKFNGSILLTNLAYDIAITIRQAQTFGVNVRESGGSFQHAYGVHFDIDNGAGGDDKQFILFVDTKKDDGGDGANNKYNYNGNGKCSDHTDECIDKYSIKRGNKISGLCVGSVSCRDCSTNSVNKLDIAFKRPNPDAMIISTPDKGAVAEAKIKISSADDTNFRCVVVNQTGQISVEK